MTVKGEIMRKTDVALHFGTPHLFTYRNFLYLDEPQPQLQPLHLPLQLPASGQPMHFLPLFLAL
jgi:hypothetical protein